MGEISRIPISSLSLSINPPIVCIHCVNMGNSYSQTNSTKCRCACMTTVEAYFSFIIDIEARVARDISHI